MSALALILAAGSAATAGAATASPVSKTQLVTVRPVTATSRLQSGYTVVKTLTGATCEDGSEVLDRAYRCFAGNAGYDPCWAYVDVKDPFTAKAACLVQPWSRQVVVLSGPSGLDTTGSRSIDKALPWGVLLGNGQRCLLAPAAS